MSDVELPDLKVGDRVYLVADDGIKKEQVRHFLFWTKDVEIDTYKSMSGIILSVSDDNNSVEAECIIRYADTDDTTWPFREYFSVEGIYGGLGRDDDDGGVIIERAGQIIFENNRELFRV